VESYAAVSPGRESREGTASDTAVSLPVLYGKAALSAPAGSEKGDAVKERHTRATRIIVIKRKY
jgi:hypothetical protein